MNSIKLSTKTSIYKPIIIEVDGKVFEVNRITPSLLQQIQKQEKAATAGNVIALVEQFKLLTGVEEKIIMEIDIRDLTQALTNITAQIFRPVKEDDPEKKVSKPGQKP